MLGLLAAGYRDHLFFISPWGLRPYVVGLPNQRLASVLNDIFFVSVMWGMVNLLPIYPLDGGQIAREIFLKLDPREGIRASLCLSIVAAVAMAVLGLSRGITTCTSWRSSAISRTPATPRCRPTAVAIRDNRPAALRGCG